LEEIDVREAEKNFRLLPNPEVESNKNPTGLGPGWIG
jgi:hypothetical protein